MTEKQIVDIVRRINFGDIDGSGDPNLDKYFLDHDYWKKVINGSDEEFFFIVSGRKGTGKSAIYRMIEEQSHTNGAIVHNTDFGEFPFSKLLSMDDDSFSKPNQYQSIWQHMILIDFARIITDHPVDGDLSNMHYTKIKEFVNVCIGNSIIDLYREVITSAKKTEVGLTSKYMNSGSTSEKTSSYNLSNCQNITQLNAMLQKEIIDYFITCNDDRKVVIQFDRLDDNYNALQSADSYLCAITSLLKYAYSFNMELRRKMTNCAKIVVYIREDILREISKIDAESSRWRDFTYCIDWTVRNTHDYEKSELYAMINKRIEASGLNHEFDFVFDTDTIRLGGLYDYIKVFKYIVDRTMHRPRDVIKFCKEIKEEIATTGRANFRSIKNAEIKYCNWLVYDELRNEINPVIKDTDKLFQLLCEVGDKAFSYDDFCSKFNSFCKSQDKIRSVDELAQILYEFGIINNISNKNGSVMMRTSFRNRGPMDKSMKLIIHKGVYNGIKK